MFDRSYALPVLLATGLHIIAAIIFATEWQMMPDRQPSVEIKQRVQASLINMDSILAMQKQEAEVKRQAAAKKQAELDVKKKAEAKKRAEEKKKAEEKNKAEE